MATPPGPSAPATRGTQWRLVNGVDLGRGQHGGLGHCRGLGCPGPWSTVTRVALTRGHHRCLGHLGSPILLSWPLANGDHDGHDPWTLQTSRTPWFSQQHQPSRHLTPVPSHLGHPSSKTTPVPVPTHGDGDGILVGRHVEDQLGCAITLGGDETLEAIGLDGDTRSRGLIWVSDVDLQGTRCNMRTRHQGHVT